MLLVLNGQARLNVGHTQEKPPQPFPPAASQTPKPSAAPTRVTQHALETSLLEWAQDKLASSPTAEQIQIRSVKELFADGRALPALVNAIVPGLYTCFKS